MANTEPPNLLLIFFAIICAAYVMQGVAGSRSQPVVPHHQIVHYSPPSQTEFLFQEVGRNREMKGDPRRSMIGSTAPTCTYNECRGCRYKCRAEQVPVEGNDPINSAYHYRCVCHR